MRQTNKSLHAFVDVSLFAHVQQEVRKVYKCLVDEDENFEGWVFAEG